MHWGCHDQRRKLPRAAGAALRIAPIVAAALLVAACSSSPSGESVKVNDLRPEVQESARTAHEELGLIGDPHTLPARGLITRLDLPRGTSLERAWQFTAEPGVSPDLIELWHRNGLHVGVLRVIRVNDFLAAIPGQPDGRGQLRIRAPFDQAVWVSGFLPKPQPIELALTPGRSGVVTLANGRLQLLVKLSDGPADTVDVDVRPHFFQPHETVEVRTPMEKALDGKIFETLALRLDLAPDRLLVIASEGLAAAAPTTQPAIEIPSLATTQPTTRPASRPAELAPPEEPPRLGEAILTSRRGRVSLQSLLIIGVHHSNPVGAEDHAGNPSR